MANNRAPKQWVLTKSETITSFESWKQNMIYTLSLDNNFANFLLDGSTWLKQTNANPLRGLTDDPNTVDAAIRRTAVQKAAHLNLMLGQIANFCPIISRNSITKNTTSVKDIWQIIRQHFGFQSTGSHFIDFDSIKLENDERPEDLFQRITAFVEDNMLKSDGGITHHNVAPATDEELSPSIENLIVLRWLQLLHKDLPKLIKLKYGTELRRKTLASIKPEISLALDSLMEELDNQETTKVMRASAFNPNRSKQYLRPNRPTNQQTPNQKICPLCKATGREHNHFLSSCKYLPPNDRRFMSRVRSITGIDNDEIVTSPPRGYNEDVDYSPNTFGTSSPQNSMPSQNSLYEYDPYYDVNHVAPRIQRVKVKRPPFFYAYCEHNPLKIVLDTGAEVDLLNFSTATYIGAKITHSTQEAYQADGITPLNVVGEAQITLHRGNHRLSLPA